MSRNDQTHFKNLAANVFDHFGTLCIKGLKAEACNFTKSNTPPWVFFTFYINCTKVENCAKLHIFMD